jgi:hypothetical protein
MRPEAISTVHFINPSINDTKTASSQIIEVITLMPEPIFMKLGRYIMPSEAI